MTIPAKKAMRRPQTTYTTGTPLSTHRKRLREMGICEYPSRLPSPVSRLPSPFSLAFPAFSAPFTPVAPFPSPHCSLFLPLVVLGFLPSSALLAPYPCSLSLC
ncbi:hypothetical protein FIBSPDRAFT_879897 [Athelia psychrophila]|uniref:Uncharacterized protein n=1 Tax=Athelia psychrophila TaxID=1759441 RepID=A0A167THF0_9AGAM|nr:hypothetical protein FIBSPDRAFT_879897 [Fibularhizoctonia sp. CBS 109695]